MTADDDSGSRWTRRSVSSVFDPTEHADGSNRVVPRGATPCPPLERLNATLGMLHANLDTLADAELRQGLAIVEASIRELSAIAFGREDGSSEAHGGRVICCAGTQLDDIVRFAIHGLHDVAIHRRIRIRWESSSQRAWVCCDEERVCFVLLDLMRNAVGLSRPGSEVIVRTWCSGCEVGVEIHDHSEGLSADERAMVAEPLWWPSWTSSDSALGLCIAWVVATAHGGRVSVETTSGVGTSLWFVLPRGLLH